MEFYRTQIPDVIICEPNIVGDSRGHFCETFRKDLLEDFLGYHINFCQDNESKSSYGVLRGMHYQLPPFAQSKLVRVLEGTVLDVALDMRNGSPFFGKNVTIELSAENKKQLFIPRGFAHGFIVLSETATFAYKCDNYYTPEFDRGFIYNDGNVNIDWKLPKKEIIISKKDIIQPSFEEAPYFNFEENLYSS